MCLKEVTEGANREESGTGYKVFIQGLDAIYSPMVGVAIAEGVWVADPYYEKLRSSKGLDTFFSEPHNRNKHCYQTGFHLFADKEDAERYAQYNAQIGTYTLTRYETRILAKQVGRRGGKFVCPDCLHIGLLAGPSGGDSINTLCPNCGSEFNISVFATKIGLEVDAERISQKGPRDPGNRRDLYHNELDAF
jgi:predicted RNA-binding Zn-ribbon protein involved in translation (DUF1610 family)